MSYWRLHYHLIWATFERQPLLLAEQEKLFYGALYQKSRELGVKVHAAGNVEDHVHIVVSIPPKLAVAEYVRKVKGASSYAINHQAGHNNLFQWQEGYGALTVDEHSLEAAMAYAIRQKEHHRVGSVAAFYEKTEEV